jgi:hypothetical protein
MTATRRSTPYLTGRSASPDEAPSVQVRTSRSLADVVVWLGASGSANETVVGASATRTKVYCGRAARRTTTTARTDPIGMHKDDAEQG